MKRRFARYLPLAFLAAGIAAHHALARAGGGHSFSGGHSGGGGHSYSGGGYSGGGYSSGGYSSGGDLWLIDAIFRLIGALIQLAFTHPLIGIPLDLFIIWIIYKAVTSPTTGHGEYVSRTPLDAAESPFQKAARAANARHRLEKLKETGDPNFSISLFNDFIYALFSKVHQARGTHRLKDLGMYLSTGAIQQLEAMTPGIRDVQGVVVGSATLEYVGPIDDPVTRVRVLFEANYTEQTVAGSEPQSWYSQELWIFTRKKGVQSRPPEKSRDISCPSCGAPPARTPSGTCPNCGTKVDPGAFDWSVESVSARRERRPPLLTSDVAEEGNELPTLFDPEFPSERKILEAMPGFSWDGFQKRALTVFHEIQKAWTARRWDKARPFETDNVFQAHYYWIAEYQRQKLVNDLRNVQVERMVPVRITRDRYYVSVTARIYASMIDFTRTEDGKVVTGSQSKPRAFTEYWTFIRSVSPKGAKVGDLNCPSCGAPLKIGMSGHCEYCGALVTSGEFDWVLSQIEQDEAYAG